MHTNNLSEFLMASTNQCVRGKAFHALPAQHCALTEIGCLPEDFDICNNLAI